MAGIHNHVYLSEEGSYMLHTAKTNFSETSGSRLLLALLFAILCIDVSNNAVRVMPGLCNT